MMGPQDTRKKVQIRVMQIRVNNGNNHLLPLAEPNVLPYVPPPKMLPLPTLRMGSGTMDMTTS
jgi:hypothetical protein